MSLLQKLYVTCPNIKANMLLLLHVASIIVVLNALCRIQEKDQGVVQGSSSVMAAIFVTSLPQDLRVAIAIVVTVYHQLLLVVGVDVILEVVLVVLIVEEAKIIRYSS